MGEVIGVRALKQNASGVVARVAAGEELTITVRGRPVARLVPLGDLDRLVASGRVRAPSRSLDDLPEPRPLDDGPSLSDLVESDRDER